MSNHEVEEKQGLHFPINVRSLPQKGFNLRLEANGEERVLLAQTHGLLDIKHFLAVFHVRPWKKRGVFIEGKIEADIVQQCVITGEAINNQVYKNFEARFVPEDSRLAKYPEKYDSGELLLDPEGDDIPETFTGSEIDAGLIAEEFFELSIDPYPRKEDVSFEKVWEDENIAKKANDFSSEKDIKDETKKSPFAALKALKTDD